MHPQPVSIKLIVVGLLLASVAFHCDKEPTPEEKRANAVFFKARQAVTRGADREARSLLLQTLALEEDLGRDRRAAEAMELLADNYSRTASFDSARELYTRGAGRFRAAADRGSVLRINLKIADLHRLLGENRAAYELYAEALRLARVFEDEKGVRDIQWAMLPTLRALDDVEGERGVLEDLQRHYTDTREVDVLARVHLEAGQSHYLRGEYDLAVQRFMRSVTMAGQTHDSVLVGTALLRVGMAYDGIGNTQDAFQYYGDALKVSGSLPRHRTLRLDILTRVANGYLRFRQYNDARRFYRLALRTAIDIGDKVAEGYLTIQLGHCSVRTDLNQAVRAYTSALSLFGDLEYAPGTAYALASLGIGYEEANQLTAAIDHLKRAVEEYETVEAPGEEHDLFTDCERVFFGPSPTYLYDRLTDLLLVTGRYDETFWYLERKNRYHLSRIAGGLTPSVHGEEIAGNLSLYRELKGFRVGAERRYKELLTRSKESRRFLGEVRDTLGRRGSTLEIFRTAFSRLHPAIDPLVRIDGVGLVEVQKSIPRDAALVVFAPTRKALYAYVVTNDRVSVELAAVERDRLLETVGEFLDLFHRNEAGADSVRIPPRPDRRFVELNQILSGWFVGPILKEISRFRHLIVVMSPDFPWLPVHVLREGRRTESPYVAENHLVSYLPAAVLTKLQGAQLSVVTDVVGLGFAGAVPWDVEYELRDIRAFYKDARLHFREDATLQTLQEEKGDVLHLAIPFTVRQRHPGNSYLLLSDGKSFSTSTEVPLGDLFSLPAFPTLVVSNLSRGGTAHHVCIPYLLLAGGSRAVIVNGFIPSRKAKKYFGELFYTSLLAGNTSTTAFRQVQVGMIKNPEYSSPHLWGVFFLWGK
jgi:tetratricopeptide (TPR) repeat protein